MKFIDRALYCVLLCCLGAAGFTLLAPPAKAQTATPFWQLTLDGVPLQENSTQAYCDAAAKASGKYPAVQAKAPTAVLDCVRRLRVSGIAAATTPPPVVVPPATGAWVTGKSTATEPKTPRPEKGVAAPDPDFRNAVFRVTDRSEPPKGFARNDYSRRQAFNANETLQLVYALDGSWHVYDAASLAYVKRLQGPAGDAEPQWHPTNPDLIYFLPTNGVGMKLLELTLSTGAARTVGDFGARVRAKWPTAAAAWTKSEGSPSADGRFWCFMVDTSAWASVGVFTWDRDTDTVVGTMSTGGERPDHVSMSPSGNYCVVSGDGARGTVAYARDFSSSRKLLAKSEHSDIALLTNGDDAYVSVDYQSAAGDVLFINLRTGERITLFPSYLSGTARAFHFSGKAYRKPGYVVISSYGEYGGAQQWMDRKIVVMPLAAAPVPLNVAWHRSALPPSDAYFFESHASACPTLLRVAFTSGWGGTATADVNAYQVRLPPIQ